MLSAGVWSTMATSYFAAPPMLPQRQGLIVNTTIDVGEYSGDFLFYDITKATINHIASGMAVDLRAYNIAAVALGLGWTRTEAVVNSIPPNGAPSKEEYNTTASVECAGPAVVALATHRNVMDKSGKVTTAENLAVEYGFTDVDGTQPKWYDQQAG